MPHTAPVEIRRRIGVLPESAGFPESQTGIEMLVHRARLFGLTKRAARARADELIQTVGLAERGGGLVARYSRGMRQRLAIARALVNEPEIVFLDEPTLGLDLAGQQQVIGLVRRIANERRVTIVLSTHLLAEVEAVCDRVVILDHGRVVAEGSVRESASRAAAPGRGRVRVPAQRIADAASIVGQVDVVARVTTEPPDDVLIQLHTGVAAERASKLLLATLMDADIGITRLEFEEGTLTDAFLALTDQ
jgi:ABC-2 type transport system ATP-binding protein